MKRITPLLLLLATLPAAAGPVIVNQGMSSADTFALRDKLAKEHEWQEWLRFQQAIKWLEVLPVNCELMSDAGGSYRCGGELLSALSAGWTRHLYTGGSQRCDAGSAPATAHEKGALRRLFHEGYAYLAA